MPDVYRTTRRVEFRDTDAAGIVHFSVFFVWMEQAEHEYLRQLGLSVHLRDAEGEISWPRVSVQCDYRSAVRFEDVLDLETSMTRRGEKSITYNFRFSHQDRLVAEGHMTSVCCRLDPKHPPRSIPIPDWIAARLPPADAPLENQKSKIKNSSGGPP